MISLAVRRGLLGEDLERVTLEPVAGLTLRQVVDLCRAKLPQKVAIGAGLNGQQVPDLGWDVELQDGDCVLVMPDTTAGVDIVGILIASLIATAASVAISYIIQLLTPRPKPPGLGQDRGDDSSPTYAWDRITTNYGAGLPVAFCYGRHTVGGQGIFSDVYATTTDGVVDDKLRLLLALCEGPIARIGDLDAVEADGLGGTVGGVTSALPDTIRVNDNLLNNLATPRSVHAITLTFFVIGQAPFMFPSPLSGGTNPPAPGNATPLQIEAGDIVRLLINTATGTPGVSPLVLAEYGSPTDHGRYQVTSVVHDGSTFTFDLVALSGSLLFPNALQQVHESPTVVFQTYILEVFRNGQQFIIGMGITDVPGGNPRLAVGFTALNATRINTVPGSRAWLRPGSLDQTPVPAPFAGAAATESPNAELTELGRESVITYSADVDIAQVSFVFAFPGGLFTQNPQTGDLAAYPVAFLIRWRPVTTPESAWRLFLAPNGQPLRDYTVDSPASSSPVLVSVVGTIGASGAVTRAPIEVLVQRLTPSGGTDTVSQCVWRNVTFFQPHALAYPRIALLGLELAAGARFSGGLPNITVRIDGKTVRVWDATNGWSPRCWDVPAAPFDFNTYPPGRNPAWILLDFLLAPWGLGKYLRDTNIDLPAFRRWAAFCDSEPNPGSPWNEAAFTCDLVGDTPRPAWEWILTICAAGRASPIMVDGKVSVTYQYRDLHADAGILVPAKATVQLFTSGNTEDLQVNWLPRHNRATVFAFQFLDEDQNHAQATLPVEDPESTINEPTAFNKDEYRVETVQAYGVTRRSQLYREGRFRHRVQRLITREVLFTTGRWALAAQVGDLISVECETLRPFGTDVPLNVCVVQLNDPGDSLVVDHAVGSTTAVVVRDADGKPQYRTVSSAVVAGSETTLMLSAAVTCNPGATCVVGLADKLTEDYEIVSITLRPDMKRDVRAVQWVPEIHEPIAPSEMEDTASDDFVQPPPTTPAFSDVSLLRITAVLGGHEIQFARPLNRQTDRAQVSIREAVERPWQNVGDTRGTAVFCPRLVPGRRYEVAVALDYVDGPKGPDDAMRAWCTADEFPLLVPPQIIGVRTATVPDGIRLQWTRIDNRQIQGFEVRAGSSWCGAQPLYFGSESEVLLRNPPNLPLLVAARHVGGLYADPVVVTLPSWVPSGTKLKLDEDDLSPSPAGTHSDTQWNATDLVLELATGKVTGTYTSVAQDMGYQAPFYWRVSVDHVEIEDSTVDEHDYPIDSGEAQWTTVDGRPASPGRSGTDWSVAVDDVTALIDDLPESLQMQGPGSHTRVLVESRYEVGGAWTDYTPHRDGVRTARKIQVRLTIDRESERYRSAVAVLRYEAFL